CPTCGRHVNPDFPDKVKLIEQALQKAHRPDLHVMVMNCIVNGVGECGNADIGVLFGKGKVAIYNRGKKVASVPTGEAVDKFIEVLNRTW
ncbi:hypothetical protein LCGC14_0918500, partial [marine sediment metagenome]